MIARWASPSEQAAVDAYRAMWAGLATAARTAKPDHAAVRRYAADQALEAVVEAVRAHRRQRRFVRGSVELAPDLIRVEPSQAPRSVTISDCVDARDWWWPGPGFGPASSGSADALGGRHRTTATVKLRGGRWVVTQLLIDPAGSC
ncbi:hypothetical protein GCM10010124_40090 [Pilimelia terevasa]|uniref:Uncharacterized protein n=1 Tax=Pilimelia terevasa TaxID=53372 RepID=A0A8J3BS62_9ACTN|nr:hypothetical protein GCM10010124_40090 [Pilimelia terevasa]